MLDEACAGYDALGFISCTGTNFIVRAAALKEVGGSPTYTLTEDFALGMALKMYGWHCRYVQEYLAIGEAPDQVRNCYQQRSRWCKVSPAPRNIRFTRRNSRWLMQLQKEHQYVLIIHVSVLLNPGAFAFAKDPLQLLLRSVLGATLLC